MTDQRIEVKAAELHQRCEAYWATLDPAFNHQRTFHGADAHLEQAARLLSAEQPEGNAA